MIQDIYIRGVDDPNYRYGVLSHSDPIESIVSKIRMLMGTRQGSVLGDLNFGLGIEDLIFETKINKIQLEEKIKSQFNQYISETTDFKIDPQVSFGNAENYDFAIIDIFVDSEKVIGILIR